MSIFVTGGNGFLGRYLLERLVGKTNEKIFCLTRTPPSEVPPSFHQTVQYLSGDILNEQAYAASLEQCDTVIHLAAATGNCRPEEFFRINCNGTKKLVEQCRKFGNKKFMFMSTIAVSFQDKRQYDYALSKEQAEETVRESGLPFTILRPTIIVGREGNAWKGLAKLARLPVLCIPGNGRNKIQPIYVGDLVHVVMSILAKKEFSGKTYELGGPQVVRMEEFLKNVYSTIHGRNPWLIMHVPLVLLRIGLLVGESLLPVRLPLSRGQLASFSNDGIVSTPHGTPVNEHTLKSIDEMIQLAC